MGITLVISVIFVIINLVVDVIYSLIDPRVVLNKFYEKKHCCRKLEDELKLQ